MKKKVVGNIWIINLPINKIYFKYTNFIKLKNDIKPYFEINNDDNKKNDFLFKQI